MRMNTMNGCSQVNNRTYAENIYRAQVHEEMLRVSLVNDLSFLAGICALLRIFADIRAASAPLLRRNPRVRPVLCLEFGGGKRSR